MKVKLCVGYNSIEIDYETVDELAIHQDEIIRSYQALKYITEEVVGNVQIVKGQDLPFKEIEPKASEAQISYLKGLGVNADYSNLTRKEAYELIKRNK